MILRYILAVSLLAASAAYARDVDGRYAQADPQLKEWFDKLGSENGLCCSYADGKTIDSPDWGRTDDEVNPYWVLVDGEKRPVPKSAVVSGKNMVGRAIVWPVYSRGNFQSVRCFMPGAEA